MRIFGLEDTRAFADEVAAALGGTCDPLEERAFEDGEHKTRPLVSVRGADCYVVQSLYGGPARSVDDKLMRLLFFMATLRDHGAARITAVSPYLAYARKDRRTKARDPVTTRYLAALIEAAGASRVVTVDVHNLAAFQNAFRCETVHLDTRGLFAARVRDIVRDRPVVVASPDPGGVKRAQLFRERLEGLLGRPVANAFVEKRRTAGVVSGDQLVGDVAHADVVVVDDLISTGGTLARAAASCRAAGAGAVHAFAAHGLFTGSAATTLADSALARVVVTDTVAPFRLDGDAAGARVETVSAAPLIAGAIKRLHAGGSITELLAENSG